MRLTEVLCFVDWEWLLSHLHCEDTQEGQLPGSSYALGIVAHERSSSVGEKFYPFPNRQEELCACIRDLPAIYPGPRKRSGALGRCDATLHYRRDQYPDNQAPHNSGWLPEYLQ